MGESKRESSPFPFFPHSIASFDIPVLYLHLVDRSCSSSFEILVVVFLYFSPALLYFSYWVRLCFCFAKPETSELFSLAAFCSLVSFHPDERNIDTEHATPA